MKKRLLAIALCGLMLTILSACSADTASSSEKIKQALLLQRNLQK